MPDLWYGVICGAGLTLAVGLALWALWDASLERRERSGSLWIMRIPRHSNRVAGVRTRRITPDPIRGHHRVTMDDGEEADA